MLLIILSVVLIFWLVRVFKRKAYKNRLVLARTVLQQLNYQHILIDYSDVLVDSASKLNPSESDERLLKLFNKSIDEEIASELAKELPKFILVKFSKEESLKVGSTDSAANGKCHSGLLETFEGKLIAELINKVGRRRLKELQ